MKRCIVLVYFLVIATSVMAQDKNMSVLSDTTVYSVVERSPNFPGGEGKLGSYIMKNLKYPANYNNEDIQSRLVIAFVVEKNGFLSNISVVRPKNTMLEKAVVTMFKSSPKWEPAVENGKIVRCRYVIPISCLLPYSE